MSTYQFDNTEGVNLEELEPALEAYREWNGKGEFVIRRPTMTRQTQKALHLWFKLIAIELNKAGAPLYMNLGNWPYPIDREWDKDAVKERLFRPIMVSITKKTSTTQLKTDGLDPIAKPLRQWLADEWKIVVPFPSQEELVLQMICNQ